MPRETRTIKNLTLKIKVAEVVESQLTPDDLKALEPRAPDGVMYVHGCCNKNYVDEESSAT